MSPSQTRRKYLLAAGVTGLGGLAGCTEGLTGSESSGENDDDEPDESDATETPTDDSDANGATPWAEWIPADSVTSDSALAFALDVQRAQAEFPPEAAAEFDMESVADSLGVAVSQFEYFAGTEPEFGRGVAFLTGTFDPAAIRRNMESRSTETDSYRGYTVVDGVAIGEDAIIVQEYRTALDARFGNTTAISSADEAWQELLSAVGSGTLAAVKTGSFDDEEDSSLPVTVPRTGIEIDASGNGGALLTGHLMFDSESRAGEVLESYESEIRTEATEDVNEELRSIEQQGRRIVLTIETDSFDF